MTSERIDLGLVVRTQLGVEGIVCSREDEPRKSWIDEQINRVEIRSLGRTEWWGILVFRGGYALSAGPLLQPLRHATYDDFLAAVDVAKATGRERLAKIFPHYVDRLLLAGEKTRKLD